MADKGHSRAREPGKNPGRAARLDAIMEAMESGHWQGADSYQEFAARLGVAISTIHDDATDAGMLLKRAKSDDEVRDWADVHLADIRERAKSDGDWSNARGAIRDRLDARGLLISKQQVSVALERVSDPELIRHALVEICASEDGRKQVIAKADELRGKGES